MDATTPSEPVPPLWLRLVVGRRPRRTLVRLVVLVLASLVLFFVLKFLLLPVRVTGISMAPNYRDGHVNFINKLAYRSHPPARGDVVGIRFLGEQVLLLKRVVGLPGERIVIRQGIIEINGEPLAEPYLKLAPAPWNEPEYRLTADEYFVVGDNRQMPGNQHTHGVADRNLIIGKALF